MFRIRRSRWVIGILIGLVLLVGVAAWQLFLTRLPVIERDYNCGDFLNWDEANERFLEGGGVEHDRYRPDGDRDGVPCESLLD